MKVFASSILVCLLSPITIISAQEVEIETPSILKNRLTLTNVYYYSDSDNGVIQSDPGSSSSDLILSANDGVAIEIGKQDSDAQFAIFYHDIMMHEVDHSGNMFTRGSVQVGGTGSILKNLRGGSITVGPDDGDNDLLDTVEGKAKVTYVFPQAYSSIPHITATTRHPSGSSFPDTFSCHYSKCKHYISYISYQAYGQLLWMGHEPIARLVGI